MKPKQLLILIAVAVVLGGGGLMVMNKTNDGGGTGDGDKLLAVFEHNDIKTIHIKSRENSVTLEYSDTGKWTVASTGNYPAEPTISGYSAFARTVAFSETDVDLITPGTGYMIVTVTVSWTDSTGTSQSLAIDTEHAMARTLSL